MASEPKRQRTRAPQNEWIAPAWKLIMAAAMIAFVVAAWLQWRTLRGIERLMSATQRPWVAASVEPVQLVFDDKGGGLTLKITVKNSGAVPAIDVLATPILLLDAKQPFRQGCHQTGIGGGLGPALATNEALPKTSTAWLARGDFGKIFPGLLAVCVKYRFANSRRTAEAGYLFSIAQRVPGRADVSVIDPKNSTLNPPELVLLPTGSYYD
jgi:hypothetical protein